MAHRVNERTVNIGARRLHTIMEQLLETLMYGASDRGGEAVVVDATYVDTKLEKLVASEDLSRWIL